MLRDLLRHCVCNWLTLGPFREFRNYTTLRFQRCEKPPSRVALRCSTHLGDSFSELSSRGRRGRTRDLLLVAIDHCCILSLNPKIVLRRPYFGLGHAGLPDSTHQIATVGVV